MTKNRAKCQISKPINFVTIGQVKKNVIIASFFPKFSEGLGFFLLGNGRKKLHDEFKWHLNTTCIVCLKTTKF